MVFAKVRDKKTQLERTVTAKSYGILGEKRYTLLGYEDEEGNEVSGPNVQTKAATKTQKKSVEPAPAKIEVKDLKPKMTRADLDAMNQDAIDRAKAIAENKEKMEELKTSGGKLPMNHPDVIAQKQRNKPGPKPKQHA